jgi:hypothetical protein
MNNVIPQTYRLSLITFGDQVEVKPIALADDNSAGIKLQIGEEYEKAVLVISGASRYTRQKAPYRVKIQ